MSWPRRKIFYVFVLILAITYVIGYLSARNSGAFALASEFGRTNSIIVEQLGEIQEIDFPILGYELRWGTVSGSARFRLELRGSKGTGTLVISLDKIGGIWSVTSAKLSSKNQVTVLK